MKALLEAGVHFGHRTRRWNPKMKPYIFTERNGIHIIDLQQTLHRLEEAYALVRETVKDGGTVLFAGTKKQAQETIRQEADRCGMPYVNQRWLGGTLTNYRTIRLRIDYMTNLEQRKMRGEFERLPKKEVLDLDREMVKLERRIGGLRKMYRLPEILFVADTHHEDLAVKEARTLNIPIIAMVDTNSDPDPIDYPIPSNDDAIRAIKLIAGKIADAVIEGQHMREIVAAEDGMGMKEEMLDEYDTFDAIGPNVTGVDEGLLESFSGGAADDLFDENADDFSDFVDDEG
jgi:small subunit ribosomal protein S2